MSQGMEFPATIWTLIQTANLHGDNEAQKAIASFCEQYRRPVIQFLKLRGILEDRVEDMAHDFLLNFMNHDSVRQADPAKGRFRSYLLTCLKNFVTNEVRHANSQRQGGTVEHLSLDHPNSVAVPCSEEQEVYAHDKAWALQMLHLSYAKLEKEEEVLGKLPRLRLLKPFLFPGGELPKLSVLAKKMKLSEPSCRTEISRRRARLRQIFREAVAQTVASEDMVNDEIAYLRQILVQPGMGL